MALTPQYDNAFQKDLDRMRKRGADTALIRAVMDDLIEERPLATSLADHPLKGQWRGYRDCHVRPDWVLIYRRDPGSIRFVRTGTHADLFG